MKIERSVIHQIVSILQDKSIGALKIIYGHHPWIQGCPSCIRKALSGTYLIFSVYTVMSKLNEGINPNTFLIKSMVRDVHDLHLRSQEFPPRVLDGCQINFFLIVKLEKSAIYQIVSILQDKSFGALKITYEHHPWSQGCIRMALSGTFLILTLLCQS